MITYSDRLKNYRENVLKFQTKREMAKYLGVSEQVYSSAENGTRRLSKNLLEKLVKTTGLLEEYWLYGIEPNHINQSELSFTLSTLENLIKDKHIKRNEEWSAEVKDLVLTALQADVKKILLNKKE